MTTKLTPAELAGPVVSGALLSQLGINRTSRFCRLCATPVCSEHGRPGSTKAVAKCHVDCTAYSDQEEMRLATALNKFVPDWRIAGPRRCPACNRPAAFRGLCERHDQQLKKSKRKKMVAYRIRRRRPEGYRLLSIHVRPVVKETIYRIADEEGVTVSGWVEDLIEAELKRRFLALKQAAAKATCETSRRVP